MDLYTNFGHFHIFLVLIMVLFVEATIHIPRKWPHHPFVLNHTKLQLQREKAMQKYDFPFSMTGIDRRSELSLKEFWEVYDAKWPVIITDVVPEWESFNWTKEFFIEKYGTERVVMKAVNGDLKDAASYALPLKKFISHLEEGKPYMWTYLQDELFIATHEELRKDVGENEYTKEDFFSLFPKEIRPWDCMLLWGTAHSRSYLHIDPYNWTGTNAVLMGKKLWKLYPPGQDHLLSILPEMRCGFPLECTKYNSQIDSFYPDLEKFDHITEATTVEFEQNPGELLIIPTGWFHQAYNAESTLAISGQMMNRNNYLAVIEEILKGNDLPRDQIPEEFRDLPREDQVKLFMYLLPDHIKEKGRKVTENVLKQVNFIPEKTEL